MNHKKYLKALLNEAATAFGIVCFILAVIVPPVIEVGGKYVSILTYFGALCSLYWSSYSVWRQEKQNTHIEKHKDLNINHLGSKIKFSSGNGFTFKKASVRIDLGITNDTDLSVSISELRLSVDTASDKVSLDKALKIVDEENGRDQIKSINLTSGQSKVVSLSSQLATTFEKSLETANYLRKNENILVMVAYKVVKGNEVKEKSIALNVSTQDLVQYFHTEWSKNGQREALAVIT